MSYLLLIAFLAFTTKRLFTYLQFFQQEEYDSIRLLRWIMQNRAFDRRATILLIASTLVYAAVERWGHINAAYLYAFPTVGLLALALVEPDPRKRGKKTLAMTARARRILWVAFMLVAVLACGYAILRIHVFWWVILVQIVPLCLVLANVFLRPYENGVQRRFLREAQDRLAHFDPTVIGVTGSYGKTSVKHILGHVLSTSSPTLVTPGSVNTPMGITRVIREQLTSRIRYFVSEMGAYGPGSITRLCDLVHPDLGIITAIGFAHYERFKSLDTVAKTKAELAEAVIGHGGKMIVTENVLEFAYLAGMYATNRANFVSVGTSPSCDLQIVTSVESNSGLELEIEWRGRSFNLRVPLHGTHQVSNIAMVFATACTVGIAPEDVVSALTNVPQIAHRYELKLQPNGSLLIDDAYNSNPQGFEAGLNSLKALRRPGGRCILITPGMIELGEAHDQAHRNVGSLAGHVIDVLLPIRPERISTFIDAYRNAKPDGIVIPRSSMKEAIDWLSTHLQPLDTVLLENDLPDLYEAKLSL